MASRTWLGTTSGDWSVTTNWSGATVPVTGDDVYIDGTQSVVAISAGLNQSAVTLATLTITDTYTGTIGTASAYLQIGATLVSLGVASQGRTVGQGSSRIKIDFGSVQTTATVFSTCNTTADAGLDPVRLIGTHASNAIAVVAGRVGIATTTLTDAATFASISLTGSESFVTVGRGATLTTLSNNGGTLVFNSAATTLNHAGGTTTINGAGLVGTINADGGQLNIYNRASGTDVTTLNWNGAGIDTKGNPASVTIGTTNVKRGGSARVFSATQVTWGTVTFDPTNTLGVAIQLD